METIIVHRKHGKPLRFTWAQQITLKTEPRAIITTPGYYYQGRTRTFRLMIDERKAIKPIWIALVVVGTNGRLAACTYEAELGATCVEFSYGRYYFGNIQENIEEINRKAATTAREYRPRPALLKRRSKRKF